MQISVIIPVINGASKIDQCLKAVFAQSLQPLEVIVVDGHSTDGTVGIAQQYPVRVVYEDYHTRAGACQVGVDEAIGEFIAFTDADCIPDKDWLRNLSVEVDVWDSPVGVGGKFEDIGKGLWTRSINLTFTTPLSGARSRWATRKEMKVLSVCGANGMVRKKNLLAVGGFKTQLRGGEDLEIATRLGKMGRLVYTPKAVVLHDHDRGLWDFIKRAFQYGKDRREAKLWDAQVAVASLSPLLFLTLLYSWVVLVGIIGCYAFMAFVIGVLTARQNKEPVFVFSVPIAFVSQHIAFTLGFWKQLLREEKR